MKVILLGMNVNRKKTRSTCNRWSEGGFIPKWCKPAFINCIANHCSGMPCCKSLPGTVQDCMGRLWQRIKKSRRSPCSFSSKPSPHKSSSAGRCRQLSSQLFASLDVPDPDIGWGAWFPFISLLQSYLCLPSLVDKEKILCAEFCHSQTTNE